MKQKIPLTFLLLFALTGVVSAQESCIASDGGINYYVRGTVTSYNYFGTGEDIIKEDYCDGDYLYEFFCDDKGVVTGKEFKCPRGCKDGACIGEAPKEPLEILKCEGSEDPSEFNMNSFIKVTYNDGTFVYFNDTCRGREAVHYFCGYTGTEGDRPHYWTSLRNCNDSCLNGVCVICSDSGGGINYSLKGKVTFTYENNGTSEVYEDTCAYSSGGVFGVRKYFCENGKVSYVTRECPLGCTEKTCSSCSNGVCNIDDIIINPTKKTSIVEMKYEEEDNAHEVLQRDLDFLCGGCRLDNKCYFYGFRKDGKFCSDENNQFISQKQTDSVCENNWECTSNVCVSGECISPSLIYKILNWFKRLFGAD